MRIAVGQLWQETNTFNRNTTSFADFENWGVAVGDDVMKQYGETGELGGFLSACRDADASVQFLGLARFACWPWGPVSADAWRQVRAAFAEQLAATGPVDAVFLALHGAMAADSESDLTGAILQDVREAVGSNTPVVGSLDLHANITRRMLEHADVLVGYHTCPHLDSFQTGQRAAACLLRITANGGSAAERAGISRPTVYARKIPMITAAEYQNTFTGPPAGLYRKLEQLEQDPAVLSAGIYMAMPWCDCPHLGWTVLLTVVEPSARWKTIVDDLAAQCWDLRHSMEAVERYPPAEVIDRALAHPGHPVVIGDGADSTNSGAPGDSTHLLRELLSRDAIPHGALTFVVDPDAVATAWQTGVGGGFDGLVGGTFAPEFSEPVRLRGVVERLVKVEFILDGHIGKNLPIRMGRGAVVRSGDVTVLLTEKSGPGSTPRLYETAGLNPRTCGIVIAKSPAGFRAEYDPFVAGTFLADTPGCASTDWPRLNYLHVNRPLFPLTKFDRPQAAAWCARAVADRV